MGRQAYIELDREFYSWRGEKDETFVRIIDEPRTWDDLLRRRRVVVLAEGGSGKSSELEERARQLRAAGHFAIFTSVEDVGRDGLEGALSARDQRSLQDWLASEDKGWFFIDSVDEAKRNDVKFRTAVRKLAKGLPGGLSRAHIVISGRHHDWDSEADISSLMEELPIPEAVDEAGGPSSESPSKQLVNNIRQRNKKKTLPETAVVVVLSALDEQQIAKYASGMGITSPQEFIDALRDQGMMGFAARPLDLEWLAAYWNQHQQVASLREMIENLHKAAR